MRHIVKLFKALENAINSNGHDVWMTDLSDTVHAVFPDRTEFNTLDDDEVKTITFPGFYKEFLALKLAILQHTEPVVKDRKYEVKQALLSEILPDIRNLVIDYSISDKVDEIIDERNQGISFLNPKFIEEVTDEIINEIMVKLSDSSWTTDDCSHGNSLSSNCTDCDIEQGI